MVSTSTFIQDTIKFIRNTLSTGITDPISASRTGRERFVMTSYPQRPVKYPIITVRSEGQADIKRLGMRSESSWTKLPIEVRIWARNETEKDSLTQSVHNVLRENQFSGGSSSSDDEELHDFQILSVVPLDESGQTGIKSMIITVQYMYILGS